MRNCHKLDDINHCNLFNEHIEITKEVNDNMNSISY